MKKLPKDIIVTLCLVTFSAFSLIYNFKLFHTNLFADSHNLALTIGNEIIFHNTLTSQQKIVSKIRLSEKTNKIIDFETKHFDSTDGEPIVSSHLVFNPIGQLFRGNINIKGLSCEIQGTKEISLNCLSAEGKKSERLIKGPLQLLSTDNKTYHILLPNRLEDLDFPFELKQILINILNTN